MKLILMYTIEDDAHRDAFTIALDDTFGDSKEFKMLDQSTYAIPGNSFLNSYFQLDNICRKVCKQHGAFEDSDNVDLYYAKNPKNNDIDICNIEKLDILKLLRKSDKPYKNGINEQTFTAMKMILMYTISNQAHHDFFYKGIKDLYGEEYIGEEKSLDQSCYVIPSDSIDETCHQLHRICEIVYKELKEFGHDDNVRLYYAKNPHNENEELCTIENIDLLKGLRQISFKQKENT